ncbi:BTB/POZ domain-containing protein [archaeon]|nr:MAG: BTB/POZ domain-containing protein [archaeon]
MRTNFAQLLPHTFRDAQHDDMCAKTTHGGDAWIADDAPGRLASQLSLHLFSHGTAAAAAVQPCVVPACEWSNDVSVGADDALRSESALACATSVYNVVTLGEWPPCLHPHNSSARASRARSMDAACLNLAAGGAVCAAAEQAAGRSVVQLMCPYCDMRTSGAAARSATTSAQGSHTAASGHHVPSTALLPMLHSAFQTPASRHTLPSHTGSARSASVAMHSGRTRGSAEYRSAHEAAGVQDALHTVESLSYEAASAHSGRRRGGVRTSGSCGAPAGSMRSENYGDNTRGGVASASYRCEGGAASPTTEHSGVAAGGEMSAMLPHAGETPRPPRRVSKEGGLPLVWTADPDTFADVTLVVQGVPLHLHRAILAARSEYFRGASRFSAACLHATAAPSTVCHTRVSALCIHLQPCFHYRSRRRARAALSCRV